MKIKNIVKASVLVFAGSMALVTAGGDDKEKRMVAPEDISVHTNRDSSDYLNRDWSLEVASGVQWSNVRTNNDDAYTMIPAKVTGALKVDDISMDDFAGGIFRGYTEFLFQGFGYALTQSPDGESRIFGVNVGPRYNFVQPGWRLVPYVQGLVGIGFVDSDAASPSSPSAHGLGEDFNFTFGAGAGVRYDINDDWYVRGGVEYTHFSSAGLSDPVPNRPIDALGPIVAVGFRL